MKLLFNKRISRIISGRWNGSERCQIETENRVNPVTFFFWEVISLKAKSKGDHDLEEVKISQDFTSHRLKIPVMDYSLAFNIFSYCVSFSIISKKASPDSFQIEQGPNAQIRIHKRKIVIKAD